MNFSNSTRNLLLAGLAMLPLTGGVALAGDADGPEAAVLAFSKAITSKNVDDMLAEFAPGGVQFTSRPSHEGIEPDSLTTPLEAHWSTVVPVLASATERYARDAKIISSRVENDVAAIWAEIKTETVMKNGKEASGETFRELYIVIDTPEGWKIAAVINSRKPDDIGLGNAQAGN